MNKYYEAFLNSTNDRDFVFREILNRFNKQPINILEIGCARNLDCGLGKSGDGWSSLFFAEYVGLNSGHLDIVELESGNLENCKLITEQFKDKITYICADGLVFLDNNKDYDLILLDAGDDSRITLQMFEKCDRNRSVILVDDANPGGKADLLRPTHPDYELFNCNYIHQMISYSRVN